MADYDLGSVGYDVTITGAARAYSDLKSIDANFKDVTKSAKDFKATVVMDSVYAQLDKVNQGTKAWIALENKRMSLLLGDLAYQRSIAQQEVATYDARLKAINAITAAIIKQRDAQAILAASNAASYQKGINKNLGVNQPMGFQDGSAMEAELDRLSNKFDRVYGATKLYENELADLRRAELNSIITTEQHALAVSDLERQYNEFVAGTASKNNMFSQISAGNRAATSSFSKSGMVIQQAGYQVGDFLVQVQSGTNFMVAFGQQATQMAGLLFMFGKKASLWGLALSVVIPLVTALGAAWMRTHKDVDAYGDAIKRATDEQKKLNDETRKLKFPNAGDQLKDQIKQARDTIAEIKRNNPGITDQQASLTDFIPFISDSELQKLQIASGTLHDLIIAEKDYTNQKAIDDATQLQNQIKLQNIDKVRAAVLAKQAFDDAHALSVKIAYNKTIGNQVAAQMMMHVAMLKVNTQQGSIFSAMEDQFKGAASGGNALLSAANNMTGPFASIAAFAAGIAKNMWMAAGAKMPTGPDVSSQTGGITSGLVTKAIQDRIDMGTKLPKQFDHTDTGGGGGSKASERDPIKELQAQLDLSNKLVGATEAQKQLIQGLGLDWSKYSPDVIDGLRKQIQAQIDLNEKITEQQGLWDTVSSASEDAIMSMVEGTMTVKDAFRKMAFDIIEQLYRVLVVQKMVGSFDAASGTGSGLVGMLAGAITGHATGGNVTAGQPYMVGEQGPEIIVPSSSGKVLTNSQSSQATSTQGSVTVQNNITVTGSDAAMVRQTVVQMLPQITQASINGMIDAKQRGGKMSAVFR